ncbi:MAG: prepilin peptidase, partial [Dehalococcoidia bacterium]
YIGYEYGLTVEAALLAIYSGFLVVIFMIDLERGLILNRVIFPATLLALALSFLRPDTISEGTIEVFWRSMAGGGIAFGTLLGIYLLARGGLGEGDVKLAAFVGLVSGFPVVVTTLLASFVGGGLVGVFLLTTRIRSRKQAVPFGPFLALSTLAHLLWGQDIYDWYIGLF